MLVFGSKNLSALGDLVYWLELGLGAVLGPGFLAGEEMPKLMRKKPKPLRRESRRLMARPFRRHFQTIAWLPMAKAE
jgi:hypothetical protein